MTTRADLLTSLHNLRARALTNASGGNFVAVIDRALRDLQALPAWLDHDAPYLERATELDGHVATTTLNTRQSMYQPVLPGIEPVQAPTPAPAKVNTTATLNKPAS